MMFEIVTLGSGSAGNALLIRGASSAFLVDAGLSAKQLTARLEACGVALDHLSGIILTHEHSDHSSALKVLLARKNLPVFCNTLTAEALTFAGLKHQNWKFFQHSSDFAVGEFTVRAFQVPHDAAAPVGFRITGHGAASFGVLTDLGHATRLIFEALRGVQGLLIEANYDEELLNRDTRRPWSIKDRIRSKHGHLSNADAARLLAELEAPELRHIILGHLSRDCNSPQLAEDAVKSALPSTRAGIHCAGQDAPGPVFSLT